MVVNIYLLCRSHINMPLLIFCMFKSVQRLRGRDHCCSDKAAYYITLILVIFLHMNFCVLINKELSICTTPSHWNLASLRQKSFVRRLFLALVFVPIPLGIWCGILCHYADSDYVWWVLCYMVVTRTLWKVSDYARTTRVRNRGRNTSNF